MVLFAYKLFKKMNADKKKKETEGKNGGFSINFKSMRGSMMQMLGGFTVLRMSSMVGMANITITKEELLKLNSQLNKVKKPKK